MVLWIEYDNEALQELADKTMFYIIGTRLAQAYVDNIKRNAARVEPANCACKQVYMKRKQNH